jgi:hypothetical protein
MSGINKIVAFAVNRIKAKFCDSVGAKMTINGTGFWVELPSKDRIFVTNKHIVEPTLKFGESTDYELAEIDIELRKTIKNQKKYFPETKYFKISNLSSSLFISEISDCAIILPRDLKNEPTGFQPIMVFDLSHLADENFHSEKVQIMDLASFIGFPGHNNKSWWDQKWNLPISRLASIASLPEMTFNNENIKTKDVTLVSGLSFSGSSGSPIICHEKHERSVLPGAFNTMEIPPKILGIMSGHWWELHEAPEMFKHSGLSYYTRSTSILELIGKLNK